MLGVTSYNVYKTHNKKKITQRKFFDTWIELLSRNHIKINQIVLFYTTELDRKTSIKFKEHVLETYNISLRILETNTINSLVNEIAQSKLVISGRMHALILGIVYNSNFISYPISGKLIEFDRMFNNQNLDLKRIQKQIQKQLNIIV